ncbi:MAG: GxxExxY protein, partial [Waddliaceae bacterium]
INSSPIEIHMTETQRHRGHRENLHTNQLTQAITGAAIEVHKRLGPGLLEPAYRACLAYELRKREFDVIVEKPVPVFYDEVQLECGFRADLLINLFEYMPCSRTPRMWCLLSLTDPTMLPSTRKTVSAILTSSKITGLNHFSLRLRPASKDSRLDIESD